MERFVYFNTENSQVLHFKSYGSENDSLALAMQSSVLLQLSNFQLKTLESSSLLTFTKADNLPIALVIQFEKSSITHEESQNLGNSMLNLFIQHFGERLSGKYKLSIFRDFDKALNSLLENFFQPIMTRFSQLFGNAFHFLHVSLVEEPKIDSGKFPFYRKCQDSGTILASAGSSIATDISAVDRQRRSWLPNKLKKKYPLKIGNTSLLPSTSPEVFSRSLFGLMRISDEMLKKILSLYTYSESLFALYSEEVQRIILHPDSKTLYFFKYRELLVVLYTQSFDVPEEIDREIHRLYSWTKFLWAMRRRVRPTM